ncbi:O-methyltransferase [Caulobacter sp. S45]|uniref:O-methyltransferase n=1 Tax=Caulobacter sp. S45 TaxID=1641861 RepID=UPI00157518C0|nr:O-methyltransferase [Caulobacter sp. S45]
MSSGSWAAIDGLLAERLLSPDPVLEAVLRRNVEACLPPIDVSPLQGRFLHLLTRITHARRVLEVGTLGGYSTICMARALPPEGRLVTLELDPHHAEVARANLAWAGVADRVEVRVGRALDLLPGVEEPIDLAFIDADKASSPAYLNWAIRLSRPAAVIVLDNVVRGGAIIDPARQDENVRGVLEALRLMGADPRLDATALQMVGMKGHDGFAMALVI